MLCHAEAVLIYCMSLKMASLLPFSTVVPDLIFKSGFSGPLIWL